MEPDGWLSRFGAYLNDWRDPNEIKPLLNGDYDEFSRRWDAIPKKNLFAISTKPFTKLGNNPLHILARLGNALAFKKAVVSLLDKEECLEALTKWNSKGFSPLHIAAERGDVYILNAVIDGVSDSWMVFELLKQKTKHEGFTALHLASAAINGDHAASKSDHLDFINCILTSKYLTFQQLDELVHTCDHRQRHPKSLAANQNIKMMFKNWTQTYKEAPKDLTFCEYQKTQEEEVIKRRVHAEYSEKHKAEKRQLAGEVEKKVKDSIDAEKMTNEITVLKSQMNTLKESLDPFIKSVTQLTSNKHVERERKPMSYNHYNIEKAF